MDCSSYKTFRRAAKSGNLVPVWADVHGDVPDPVTAYRRLCTPGASFILENAGPDGLIRRSVIGTHPWLVVTFSAGRMKIQGDDRWASSSKCVDPLEGIGRILSSIRAGFNDEQPLVESGLVGNLNYEVIRHWGTVNGLDSRMPAGFEARFMAAGLLVVYDHESGRVRAGVMVRTDMETSLSRAYFRALNTLEKSIGRLTAPPGSKDVGKGFRVGPLRSGFSKTPYMSAVEAAKNFIQNGDVIQVVVSRTLTGRAVGDDITFYESLRSVSPSPYLFHLDFGRTRLIGASPEMLVRLEGRKIAYKPIAGTRPRGSSPEEDFANETELQNDPKERAEHVMLVDLGRNEVGRVAVPGSVHVTNFMGVERYSHVMHLVSRIEGELEEGKDGLDLLMAVFPAGTVTGSPKIRAMEIIAGLEPRPRGPYAGALGCLGWNGDLDLCIPIRTAFLQGERITLQAGAGIVRDSVPGREFLETRQKIQSLISAIKRSSAGQPDLKDRIAQAEQG